MKMRLNLGNSIYQSGLTVQNGRLVNNAPDSRMGITKIADANREMKRQQKIDMQTQAILRAEEISEMREMMMGGECESCD